jgi:hypothetical protein
MPLHKFKYIRVNFSWSIPTTYNTTHWTTKCQGSLMVKVLGQPNSCHFLSCVFCFSVLWCSWICNHPSIRPFIQIWISRIMKVRKLYKALFCIVWLPTRTLLCLIWWLFWIFWKDFFFLGATNLAFILKKPKIVFLLFWNLKCWIISPATRGSL